MDLRKWVGLIGWLTLCYAAAFIGSRFPISDWYAELAKPSWNPPNWVFGPVWSALYTMMAVAAWMVWRKNSASGRSIALKLFVVQLIFNGLWSWLFFGLQRPDLALVDIILLWMAIFATIVAFRRVRRTAAWLLIPYAAWVTFAAALNTAIWYLNT